MDTLVDWTRLYEAHKGQWVSLGADNETVVGASDTPEAALVEAASRGARHAAVTYVPTEVIAFAGAYEGLGTRSWPPASRVQSSALHSRITAKKCRITP